MNAPLRSFAVRGDVATAERRAVCPWEEWTVFLHPEQRQWVERDLGGPARVGGSAGTGKTIVALHRAVPRATAAILDAHVETTSGHASLGVL